MVKTLIDTFQYPRKGPGMMWEAAAKQYPRPRRPLPDGTRTAPPLLRRRSETLAHRSRDTATVETYTARHVISSAPVRELIDCSRRGRSRMFHARALRYRDFITVALMVKKPELFPTARSISTILSVKVSRVQNFRSWSPEMAPEGMSCLGLEYFCFEGDDLWNASDDELIALAKKEIAQIGLVAADDIADACVVRQPKAYPIYDDDYRHNMAMIRLDLETHYPTLHLVGRNGMHKYNNLDHAMMTAMLTARNILAGERIHDVWNVNEDAEYHEAENSGYWRGADQRTP